MLSAGTSLWRVTRQRFQDGGNSEVSGLSFVGESCDTIYCTCRPILIALPSTIPETNLRIVQYLSSWLGCIQKSTLLMAPFWRISASASGNLSKTTTKTTGIKVNLYALKFLRPRKLIRNHATGKWDAAVGAYLPPLQQSDTQSSIEDFEARQHPAALASLREQKLLPPWDAVAAQIRKGPPPFLRPGWKSPLIGQKVNLEWIDRDVFTWIQGSREGWRNKKVLVIEFWAS